MKAKDWVIWIIFFVLVAVGGFFGYKYVKKKMAEPKGMYIQYGEQIYEAENSGAIIEYVGAVPLSIKHSEGWGLYSVSECQVRIVPTTTSRGAFTYTVEGEEGEKTFSELKDVTAAFLSNYATYDGKGLTVDKDGVFKLEFDKDYSMETALSRVHSGKKVTLTEQVDVSTYPYFVLQVVSPDETEGVLLPFKIVDNSRVTGVKLDKKNVVFY